MCQFAGRPFAVIMSMIPLIIGMKALSENPMEPSREIASLIVSVGTKKGCEPAGA